jgi:hypothetical protein
MHQRPSAATLYIGQYLRFSCWHVPTFEVDTLACISGVRMLQIVPDRPSIAHRPPSPAMSPLLARPVVAGPTSNAHMLAQPFLLTEKVEPGTFPGKIDRVREREAGRDRARASERERERENWSAKHGPYQVCFCAHRYAV